MRTRAEVEGEVSDFRASSQHFEELRNESLIIEILLDIRELLANPGQGMGMGPNP